MKQQPDITVVLGPGNHQHKLVEAMKSGGICFEVFNYHPAFTHQVFDAAGKEIHSAANYTLTRIVRFLWALCIRVRPLRHSNYHTYLQYSIFDRWVSRRASAGSRLLWAWTQTSLRTMKVFRRRGSKVILEHPTIHVDEWNHIIRAEYDRYAPKAYKYYLHSPQMTARISQEYVHADTIILLSGFAKSTFNKDEKPPAPVVLVPLYAGAHYSKALQAKAGGGFTILFAGRIDILKGIHRLLPVFKKLHEQDRSIRLVLIGEVKEEILEIIELYRAIITIKDHMLEQELAKEYQGADLLVLPSVQESFGLVMLEALACGTPVLASVNTGAPDLRQHCAQVTTFDPYDAAELETKLLEQVRRKKQAVDCDMTHFSKIAYEKTIHNLVQKALDQ